MQRAAREYSSASGNSQHGHTRAHLRSLLTLLAAVACLLLAACDLLKEHKLTPGEECDIQLKKMQVAIEEGIGEGSKAKVAVLGIVDASAIAKTVEGDAPETKSKDKSKGAPEDPAAPLARERKVRDAINASLVQNRLMELLQPDEASIAVAREDMLAANSAALSLEKCKDLGEKLGAEYIAGAIVDEEGKSVSVSVQRVSDGVVVYQDVLREWPAVIGEEAAPAEDSKKK